MWLYLLVVIAIILYFSIQRIYSHWRKNGVPGPNPVPLIGNFGKSFVGAKSIGETITDIYKKYDRYPFVGVYQVTTPILIIRDPEFIKKIFVTDFKYFHDNLLHIDMERDPIFGRNPFVMKGIEWRNKRAQLTQSFTSGKIKGMYPFLENNSKRMLKYIEDETKNLTSLESRDIFIRLTLDNIAACAFGLEGKCFDEPYSDFRDLAEKFLSPGNFFSTMRLWLTFNFPSLSKYLKVKVISKEVEDRLIEIVRKTLKFRKDNNIVRNDLLDECTNLSTEKGLFTDLDIAAHSASFLADGYETSSRVMSFLLYELAANPDVQEKLRQELNENFERNGNNFTYESIHEMKYLDACLSESLRKNAVFYHLGKRCTEDFTYTATNPDFENISIKLKVGDTLSIPLRGLQSDPKYFDNPDQFILERFISKEEINKFTYLPFGDGPRVCLGLRFAQTQLKVGIAYIIKHFRCSVNSKTQLPLKFDPYYIMLHPIGGLWLNFEKM